MSCMDRWRDCYSDEHYFATLLATKNLDEETDCEGQSMHVDWSFGGEHPRSYSVRETTSSRYPARDSSGLAEHKLSMTLKQSSHVLHC